MWVNYSCPGRKCPFGRFWHYQTLYVSLVSMHIYSYTVGLHMLASACLRQRPEDWNLVSRHMGIIMRRREDLVKLTGVQPAEQIETSTSTSAAISFLSLLEDPGRT